MLLLSAYPVGAASPAEQLSGFAKHLDHLEAQLQSGNLVEARSSYTAFEDGWYNIEDGIREQSKASYRAIEESMVDLRYGLETEPFDIHKAEAALGQLRTQIRTFTRGDFSTHTKAATALHGPVTLSTLVARLDRAQAKLDANDRAGAAEEISSFRRDWIEVEGLVKAKSARTYTDTENNMAKAYAVITQSPPDLATARATLTRMKTDLEPFAVSDMRYGKFDAAVILLREGMEALLVVAALLAFLTKTNNAEKKPWIWAGSAAGVAASVVIAFVVTFVFSQADAGVNRELLEGLTGLIAAAMLVYVGHWLHSKVSLDAWHRYIHDKGKAALAKNSLLSLAVIAFLAVFREGAETVLFYVGMAPSISLQDLLLGLVFGAAGLVVIGVLILTFGLRIPTRPFFLGTSLLLYYLAFKFVGTGIHALQVAGVLSASPADFLPENGLLGLFPTWETTVAQMVIVLGVATISLVDRSRRATELNQSGQRPPAK